MRDLGSALSPAESLASFIAHCFTLTFLTCIMSTPIPTHDEGPKILTARAAGPQESELPLKMPKMCAFTLYDVLYYIL